VLGNRNPPHAIRLPHVEHDLFIDHDLVVQREVIAVGIEVRLIKRVDDDVRAEMLLNLVARENHV
jgi:hypothetical protein